MSKIVATFVQNLAKRWLFISVIQDKFNSWRKIVNHWDKPDNVDMNTGKEIKAVRNKKKWKLFYCLVMIELFETNRMSHLPPFYDKFFL